MEYLIIFVGMDALFASETDSLELIMQSKDFAHMLETGCC